ncbi:MAG TPA: 3-hydroxybutyrate oligomer hydrolase family protein [Dokdonella sp.]|uniref:3-hydroxybutyrate oligomer hydrolase family protein n=1 Tax=Dokdonella sp. TaxID=2291710 RepID=UPI002D144DD8|nr:3-hydroxybutyrate oligomer hydrolase family protein [Dokdonella sp.]HUD41883.1 3-hydroxybutyrate oligomer hydrolase family protein [Dokdonella sp.]
MTDFLVSPVRETRHAGGDDLLTAGLGPAGLRGAAAPFADPDRPSAAELRRRAIQASWKGIADLGPLGGYGTLYGSTDPVPGREYSAFARLPGAQQPHRVLVQVPDDFDARTRCLVVTASSGSRGIYGAIALAGAAGLPRGCAVAYTDKGTGSGYFDIDSRSGVQLDGTRAVAGQAMLEFEPAAAAGGGVAVKHAHSGDQPEADWGRHVLQAARFGLAMLDRARPDLAPFTPANTRVIAIGLSNGGGAVLQAAGLDEDLLDAVVALAPNVAVPGQGRPLYDYVTEAALALPCALLDRRFDAVPFAREADGSAPLAWQARCASLQARGLGSPADALAALQASGWTAAALATAASSTRLDLWRAVAATYASAYLRAAPDAMPCGYRFAAHDAAGQPVAASAAVRAAWWADASGIPPGAGIALLEDAAAGADPAWPGLDCLRALWTGDGADAARLRAAVAATEVRLPRRELPLVVIHGEADGLIPIAFSGLPYVQWLRDHGRAPVWWPIADGQHFDAFLAMPGFGDRYVPLLPYGDAAFERVLDALREGRAVELGPAPATRPRGARALDAAGLGLR